MKVVGLTSFDPAQDMKRSLGGLGGFFSLGMRWADYVEAVGENEYTLALREYIVQNEIKEGGGWHQDEGVPVFEDGTVASFSFRAWGDLLAAIWSEELNQDFCYMDFYL